jgi:drug/metabolite transporter (DMT)-like permease
VRNWLSKLITTFGVVCVVVGVSWDFIDVWTHFRFDFLSDHFELFLAALGVGIVLSMGGAIAWARRFDRPKKFRVAGGIFLIGAVALMVAPKNVHGPGMLLVFASFWTLTLSLVIGVLAVFTRAQPAHATPPQ